MCYDYYYEFVQLHKWYKNNQLTALVRVDALVSSIHSKCELIVTPIMFTTLLRTEGNQVRLEDRV